MCAWLYWHYGLASAMIGHALFHLVWWPVDVRMARSARHPILQEEASGKIV